MGLTVHFIRHGETDWNREKRIQGHIDVPLNSVGRAQARAVAAALLQRPLGAVISSDLRRATATAAGLVRDHALELTLEPALRERDFGVVSGRLDADLAAEYGPTLADYWQTPDAAFPDGESVRQHHRRVSSYLDRLLADPPAAELAIVTHGGTVIRALDHLRGRGVDEPDLEPIANGSIHTALIAADGSLQSIRTRDGNGEIQ